MQSPLIRILPIIIMCTGMGFTGNAPGALSSTSPSGISFSNNQQVNVRLSNTNPNKIIIEGELITKLDGMEGAYQESQTESGALILSPLSGQNFTVFIQTQNGASLSLNVTPEPGPGKTVTFIPRELPMLNNEEAKSWEENQPYIDTLKSIALHAVNGKAPPDFIDFPISRTTAYQPPVSVNLIPERQFIGSHLRVVRYRMHNPGSISVPLQERQFYLPGVRAVTLSTRHLFPGGQGFAWVIFSFQDGGQR
ncbi:type-F conjugative transfer system secretin TraK [Serratia proteamaculans]|uniref:type-F conjugative transfer system secretin TraK n=1 Tax=Serratia proteamaculans TaxID=28151 RepID=UPI0039BE0D9F